MSELSPLSQEEIDKEQQKLNTLDPKKAVVFTPAQMFALANQCERYYIESHAMLEK
jgi:hypothetical protein